MHSCKVYAQQNLKNTVKHVDIYHVYMQSIQNLNRFIFLFLYFTILFFALFFYNKETKDKIDLLLNRLHVTALRCCSHSWATLTATPLQIIHFSVFSVSAQSQRNRSKSQHIRSGVANDQNFSNLSKKFSIRSAVFLESYCCLRGFAVSGVRRIFQWGGLKGDIKDLFAIYTLANKQLSAM